VLWGQLLWGAAQVAVELVVVVVVVVLAVVVAVVVRALRRGGPAMASII
jgi:hypothetical protein